MQNRVAFLSTFPLRGTSRWCCHRLHWRAISIHVPLAGNVYSALDVRAPREISIHVPLAGNVSGRCRCPPPTQEFLSTFPLRGTSRQTPRDPAGAENFYPRSPCGERRKKLGEARIDILFLSTFPLRGTSCAIKTTYRRMTFLSTFPLRGTSLEAVYFSDTA